MDVAAAANILIAASQAKLVSNITSGMREVNARTQKLLDSVHATGTVGGRRAYEAEPTIKPRKVHEPEPTIEPRKKITPDPVVDVNNGEPTNPEHYTSSKSEPTLPAPWHQPIWDVVPPPPPKVCIKQYVQGSDSNNKGTLLDRFM